MSDNFYQGFNLLESELNQILNNTKEPMQILEDEAKEFVKDLLKLPKPISKIRKSGYTHLIHTFSYRVKNKEIEVGWGKYYGPMLENGTSKMNPKSHLKPCWEKNSEKYYKHMIAKIFN